MNQDISVRMSTARARLILDHPFFGALSLRLKLVESEGIPTLAVDGKHIFYNPKFIGTLTDDELKAAFAHEVLHCVYDHIGRRGERNPQKWNIAGDYVINDVLQNSGFTLGKGWLHNPAYANMSSDHIYSLLPDMPEGGGKGTGQPGGALCDIMDGPGDKADPAEVEANANDWKIATIQAANAARKEGKLPDSLERFIDEITENKVDWKAQLRRFITEKSQNDYSWSRPNRRFLSAGIFLPSLYSEAMGEIAVVVDTSGSIDAPTLAAFGAEINAIRDSVRPACTRVIYCDARVNHVDEFDADSQIKLKAHGGGGTDFRPPFHYIDEHGHQPKCLVYLTDGYGPFPDGPADYPTIWCMTTKVEAPWGETTRIDL